MASTLPSPSTEQPLAYRATRGGVWAALGSYFTTGVGFLANLLLTRLLTPEDFGIYALGTFFFILINLETKSGIGSAFGQRRENTGELIGTHLALDISAGVATLVVTGIAIPILLWLGYSSDVVWVMVAVAIAGAANAFGNTAVLLLEKALYFRQTALLGGLVFALSYLPALWLAWNHFGYWSLVVQNIVATVPLVIGVWWLARRQLPALWQLRWRFDRAIAQGLLRFGVAVGISGMFAMLAMSMDNFLVGTFVGVAALGFYDRAYRLAEWPNKLVTSVVTRTAFYTYAHLQNDVARLQKTVTMLSWVLAVITLPIALVIFATAPDLVALLYGERWLPTAVFLRLLVVYSLIRPMLDNAGSLLVATGHPKRGTFISIIHAVLLVAIATPLTLAYETIGTCVGVGIAFVIALILAGWQVRRTVPLRILEIWFAPVTAAIIAGLAFAIFENSMSLSVLPLIVRLVVNAGFVGLVFFAVLFAIRPRQLVERSQYVWQLVRASPIDDAKKIDG